MASQPHDMTGKICADCTHVFTANQAGYAIPTKTTGMVVWRTVCGYCHNKHHSKGEI